MATSFERLVVRLSNQLVTTMEDQTSQKTQLQLLQTQMLTMQADNSSLTRQLCHNAAESAQRETSVHLLQTEREKFKKIICAASNSARTLRNQLSPKGRFASLFDDLIETLNLYKEEDGAQHKPAAAALNPMGKKRRSRRNERSRSPSPSSATT